MIGFPNKSNSPLDVTVNRTCDALMELKISMNTDDNKCPRRHPGIPNRSRLKIEVVTIREFAVTPKIRRIE